MTTYVMLASWTDQGIRNIAQSPTRLDDLKRQLEQMGGQFVTFYMTMGIYDIVIAYEAPDDAVAAHFTLVVGQQGNLRTKTLKAFPERAYREIIASLAKK